jgi:hypothetical protein
VRYTIPTDEPSGPGIISEVLEGRIFEISSCNMTAKVRGTTGTLRPPSRNVGIVFLFWKPFISVFSSVPYFGACENVEQVLVFESCSWPSGKKQGNFIFSIYTINIHAVYMELLV